VACPKFLWAMPTLPAVIGKGSVIGGNVWVTESIPPYSVVVQKHAEIEIRNANSNDK
jgi:serine O-acetyltransferase